LTYLTTGKRSISRPRDLFTKFHKSSLMTEFSTSLISSCMLYISRRFYLQLNKAKTIEIRVHKYTKMKYDLRVSKITCSCSMFQDHNGTTTESLHTSGAEIDCCIRGTNFNICFSDGRRRIFRFQLVMLAIRFRLFFVNVVVSDYTWCSRAVFSVSKGISWWIPTVQGWASQFHVFSTAAAGSSFQDRFPSVPRRFSVD